MHLSTEITPQASCCQHPASNLWKVRVPWLCNQHDIKPREHLMRLPKVKNNKNISVSVIFILLAFSWQKDCVWPWHACYKPMQIWPPPPPHTKQKSYLADSFSKTYDITSYDSGWRTDAPKWCLKLGLGGSRVMRSTKGSALHIPTQSPSEDETI